MIADQKSSQERGPSANDQREIAECSAQVASGGSGEEQSGRSDRRAGQSKQLGDLLNDLAAAKKWQWRLLQHAVFISWPDLVGREIASVAKPELIRDAVLWVRVIDSVWSQQLQFETTTLLAKINQGIPKEAWIGAIRFRFDPSLAGEYRQERNNLNKLTENLAIVDRSPGPSREKLIPREQEERFVRLIAGIADPEARANLLRLWRKSQGVCDLP